jgi:hypothetical protein
LALRADILGFLAASIWLRCYWNGSAGIKIPLRDCKASRRNALINEEPAHERDPITLVPLDIKKGKPFTPDDRQKKILIEATAVGELMPRAMGYASASPAL